MSRDGLPRLTLKVECRVGLADLVDALAAWALEESFSEEGAADKVREVKTRDAAARCWRRQYARHGDNIWAAFDGHEGEREAVAAATKVAARLFPDLRPQKEGGEA